MKLEWFYLESGWVILLGVRRIENFVEIISSTECYYTRAVPKAITSNRKRPFTTCLEYFQRFTTYIYMIIRQLCHVSYKDPPPQHVSLPILYSTTSTTVMRLQKYDTPLNCEYHSMNYNRNRGLSLPLHHLKFNSLSLFLSLSLEEHSVGNEYSKICSEYIFTESVIIFN